jgi:hypothetical protein
LQEARSQFAEFNASAFPYRGIVPDTRRPFLDAHDGKRHGHTTEKGAVLWEDATYSDRHTLLHLPAGYNPQLPSLIVLYLHGQGTVLERDVVGRQALPRQLADTEQNAVLVAPQLAYDAIDSSIGNFWRPGFFATYIDEAAERLMRLFGDERLGAHFNAAPVVIVAYSGGYLAAAYALERGGAAHRIKGVILMDALYDNEDKFAAWASSRRRAGFLLSAYTTATQEANDKLRHMLGLRHVPFVNTLPKDLSPGTVAFVACGSGDLHNELMTRAWEPDPLSRALAMIPGYPRKTSAPASPIKKGA